MGDAWTRTPARSSHSSNREAGCDALRSHLPGSVLSEGTPLSGLVDDDVPAPTTLAARAAFEEAGVGAADLDVVECQDTDAARELLSYEELGELTDELPAKERAAIVLRYGYDLPYDDIAAALGSSPEAARQAASSGVRRLRARRST